MKGVGTLIMIVIQTLIIEHEQESAIQENKTRYQTPKHKKYRIIHVL